MSANAKPFCPDGASSVAAKLSSLAISPTSKATSPGGQKSRQPRPLPMPPVTPTITKAPDTEHTPRPHAAIKRINALDLHHFADVRGRHISEYSQALDAFLQCCTVWADQFKEHHVDIKRVVDSKDFRKFIYMYLPVKKKMRQTRFLNDVGDKTHRAALATRFMMDSILLHMWSYESWRNTAREVCGGQGLDKEVVGFLEEHDNYEDEEDRVRMLYSRAEAISNLIITKPDLYERICGAVTDKVVSAQQTIEAMLLPTDNLNSSDEAFERLLCVAWKIAEMLFTGSFSVYVRCPVMGAAFDARGMVTRRERPGRHDFVALVSMPGLVLQDMMSAGEMRLSVPEVICEEREELKVYMDKRSFEQDV